MQNHSPRSQTVSMESYLANPSLVYGFRCYYENEPFDTELNCLGYEIGRQLGAAAKALGYNVKSQLIRRKPNSAGSLTLKSSTL